MTATNGQVALDMLQSGSVAPDIIFLDLNMPLMNGQQFLQEIRSTELFTHVPIIVLTTSGDSATKTGVLQLGAKEFITKPDKFSGWEKALTDVVAGFIE